jgi:hypothetical protein
VLAFRELFSGFFSSTAMTLRPALYRHFTRHGLLSRSIRYGVHGIATYQARCLEALYGVVTMVARKRWDCALRNTTRRDFKTTLASLCVRSKHHCPLTSTNSSSYYQLEVGIQECGQILVNVSMKVVKRPDNISQKKNTLSAQSWPQQPLDQEMDTYSLPFLTR